MSAHACGPGGGDESQHFNRCRALCIRGYPRTAKVAFDTRAWLTACDAETKRRGG